MIHRYLLFLIATIFALSIQPVSAKFDQQRPDGVHEEKWLSLKSAVQEAKFLPAPTGTGGARSEFGRKISVDGNRALIGAPGMVNSRGSALIYEYDGTQWNESALLIPNDAEKNDFFGVSVSLSGDVALVGARFTDDNGSSSGSAYLFRLINGNWVETAKLTASDAGEGHFFGSAVDLSTAGDRVLIGAYEAEGQSLKTGAAYVFDYIGSNWIETAKLSASDGGTQDWFGVTVSLSGDHALIGAPRHNDNLNGVDSGAAYVFDYDGNSWAQSARLRPVDGASDDRFAYSVNLDDGRAALGSHNDDDLGDNSGSAYVFDFNGSSWAQTIKLTATDGAEGDNFGKTVSLSGDQVLIGASLHDLLSGDEGAAYLFELDGNNWGQTTKLSSSDVIQGDYFGYAVSLSNDRILVSALGDDDVGVEAGTVFIYDYDGNSWVENHKLVGREGAARDEFGHTSVSLSGNKALVGAYRDFVPGLGYSGTAYIFEYDGNTWSEQAQLKSFDAPNGEWFGRALSLRGDRAIIGSYRTYSAYIFEFNGNKWIEMAKLSPEIAQNGAVFGIAVDIEGDRAVIGTRDDGAGAAYVYSYDGIQWNETAQLTASDGEQDDLFGNSVSLLGNRVVIGSREDDDIGAAYVFDFDGTSWIESIKLTASDGPFFNFAWSVSLSNDRLIVGNNSHSAYVFDLIGNNWVESAILKPFEGVVAGLFGESVSLHGDLAVVGAAGTDDGGTVFVYQFDGNSWNDTAQLIAANVENGDQFGNAVSLSDDRVLIGAYGDDDRGTNAGAAYVFNLNSTYLIGGQVSGLAKGNSLALQNNAVDDLTVTTNGHFSFNSAVADFAQYSVTVLNQPTAPNQTCLITGGNNDDGTGTLTGSNATDIVVTCTTNQYFIGGYITDLIPDNHMVLSNNGVDELTVNSKGAFVFAAPLDDQQKYHVTIETQPNDPIQSCELVNSIGNLSGIDIDNVLINCEFGDDLIFRNGFDAVEDKGKTHTPSVR